jgi:hypothetical protein
MLVEGWKGEDGGWLLRTRPTFVLDFARLACSRGKLLELLGTGAKHRHQSYTHHGSP